MTQAEEAFSRELRALKSEADSGIQFFYTYLAIKAVLAEDKAALDLLNENVIFWRTILGALQAASFMSLGRAFDRKRGSHGIDSLLRATRTNSGIFIKPAFRARRLRENASAHKWIDEYVSGIHEPTERDFRRLECIVAKYREQYERVYRVIRHKIYAHRSKGVEMEDLFQNTKIRDLERLFVFLNRLHEAMWQLFHNGRKPNLRFMRSSVQGIRKNMAPRWETRPLQEEVVRDADDFFQLFCHGNRKPDDREVQEMWFDDVR